MNYVEPIRDINLIYDIADYLKARSERNYVLFMFGIYTGLRISDILQFRVRDVRNKSYIIIREIKTKKDKRFELNKDLIEILNNYIKNMEDYEYLFKSKKGANKPITRVQAYRILKDAAQKFGLESIGTHTLRKTFGYHLYMETKDAVLVKEALNHSDMHISLIYIGVNQTRINNGIKQLKFMRKRK